MLSGPDRLEALSQQVGLLRRAGKHREAVDAADETLALLEAVPEVACDVLVNRSVALGYLGEVPAAMADAQRALQLGGGAGGSKWAADIVHNLGWLAGRNGDVVGALRHFDDAAARYAALGQPDDSIYPDRCEVLLAAGCGHEALRLAERSARALERAGDTGDLAETLLLVARASRVIGDYGRSQTAAAQAAELFAESKLPAWEYTSRLLELDVILAAGGEPSDEALGVCLEIVEGTSSALPSVAAEARIVAAEMAVLRGESGSALDLLGGVDRVLVGPAGVVRALRIEAEARLCQGDEKGALACCEAGVQSVSEMVSSLGASELRVTARRHAVGLADLGVQIMLRRGESIDVLEWVERHRARALDAPAVRPPDDDEFAEALALLRAARAELASAGPHEPTLALRRRCVMLEDRVRRHARRASGQHADPSRPSIGLVQDGMGDSTMVEWFDLGGVLHAIVVKADAVHVSALGTTSGVLLLAADLRMSLARQLAGTLDDGQAGPLDAHVRGLADELDRALFMGIDIGRHGLILSPTASMSAFPWGVLPTTAGRVFTTAPSTSAWFGSHRRTPHSGKPVVVAGPDLVHGAVEARQVAGLHPNSILLVDEAATTARVLAAADGASLLHVACHGTFAADNPMFSTLLLADGPLFVYHLERLGESPSVVVLAACHGALGAAHPGDELLGLTSTLLAAGTRTIVASCLALPDSQRLVDAVAKLHSELARGVGPAEALMTLRLLDPPMGGALVSVGAG